MAEARRKVLITTESREIVVVRTGEAEIWWHCPKCDTEVQMMTADAAGSASGARTMEIFQMVEKGRIHSVETITGQLLICVESLAAIAGGKLINRGE